MEQLTSNQGQSRSECYLVTSVRGAQEKRWVRPRGEGRSPGRLGLGFALWVEGTAARGRCHMLNQDVHNLGNPPGSIKGMVEASR